KPRTITAEGNTAPTFLRQCGSPWEGVEPVKRLHSLVADTATTRRSTAALPQTVYILRQSLRQLGQASGTHACFAGPPVYSLGHSRLFCRIATQSPSVVPDVFCKAVIDTWPTRSLLMSWPKRVGT